tara:strand:- start:32 stop:1471 length:1440 start_codon:yes stop_codon:yes gene_type:complete
MRYSEIKLVEQNLEGDALYAKLIKQQFPMGAGYELNAGMTHEMWYKELKLANRWLAAVVRAGELQPPVSIGNDFTIRDKTGQDIGIPGQWDPSMKPKAAKPVNESKVYLKEAEARIQHAEDIVFWEGSKGAARALESLRNLEKGKHTDVTIKWDGSPAIIFGRNEEGEFILTDKSGFVAVGYDGKAKSPEALANMFLNRSGGKNRSKPGYVAFANNMKNVFNAYRDCLPEDFEGYFKGDLLYFNTPPVNEQNYFEFKPNIVTYEVKKDSELGTDIQASTTGVVVHRILNEKGTEGPISVDLNSFFQGDDVLVFPPQTVEKAPVINNESISRLKQTISKNSVALDKLLDETTLVGLKMKDFPKILYAYTNSKVDTGLDSLGSDFFEWIRNSKVSGVKQKKILEHVQSNTTGWTGLWDIVSSIMSVKDDIINQFDSHDAIVRSSIDGQSGGEGYVLAHPEGDIKLVPRATFSKANRAVKRD